MKFICYNYLSVYCDYIIDYPIETYLKIGIKPLHNYNYLDLSKLKDNDKVFIKSDFLTFFFTKIFHKIKSKFYLITGASDIEINNNYKIFLDNPKIIKWIGCNITIQNHPKICKFLIGFQERERSTNGTATGNGGDQQILYECYKNNMEFNKKKNNLFITYFNNTHSSRNNILNIFKKESFSNFVIFGKKMSFKDYLYELNNYKFVLCPRGNGVDTHRFSEILLMNSIPVLEKNGLSDLYSKFPCIIVDNFSNVTIDLLNNTTFDNKKYLNFLKYILIENNIVNSFLDS